MNNMQKHNIQIIRQILITWHIFPFHYRLLEMIFRFRKPWPNYISIKHMIMYNSMR